MGLGSKSYGAYYYKIGKNKYYVSGHKGYKVKKSGKNYYYTKNKKTKYLYRPNYYSVSKGKLTYHGKTYKRKRLGSKSYGAYYYKIGKNRYYVSGHKGYKMMKSGK